MHGSSIDERIQRWKERYLAEAQEKQIFSPMNLHLYNELKKGGSAAEFVSALELASSSSSNLNSCILNQVTPSGNSLLHVAAQFGNEQIVKLLASHFPHLITKTNVKGDTVLHVCARNEEILEVVIWNIIRSHAMFSPEKRDDYFNLLKMKNEHGNTALHEALIGRRRRRRHEVAYTLIQIDPTTAYTLNKQGESPFCLALRTSNESPHEKPEGLYLQLLRGLLLFPDNSGNKVPLLGHHQTSPLHVAILERKPGVLKWLLEERSDLMYLKDEEGGTPLHFAVSKNYLEGIHILMKDQNGLKAMVSKNTKGYLPIHVACEKGYVEMVKLLLQQEWFHPTDMLTQKGQNVFHVAAKNGQLIVVNQILRDANCERLLNEKDKNGNTPLHLASKHLHPRVLISLIKDKRVNKYDHNNEDLTAADILLRNPPWTYRERLTYMTLASGGVTTSEKRMNLYELVTGMRNGEVVQGRTEILLVVAALVATVTFAAGFTIPGGVYSDSNIVERDQRGLAILVNKINFQIFTIANTISMLSSVLTCIILFWARTDCIALQIRIYLFEVCLLGLALFSMTLAFVAATSLLVSNNRALTLCVASIGFFFFIMMLMPLFMHDLPLFMLRVPYLRNISRYSIKILTEISESTGKATLEKLKNSRSIAAQDQPKDPARN